MCVHAVTRDFVISVHYEGTWNFGLNIFLLRFWDLAEFIPGISFELYEVSKCIIFQIEVN